jgi:hypothetical protein
MSKRGQNILSCVKAVTVCVYLFAWEFVFPVIGFFWSVGIIK